MGWCHTCMWQLSFERDILAVEVPVGEVRGPGPTPGFPAQGFSARKKSPYLWGSWCKAWPWLPCDFERRLLGSLGPFLLISIKKSHDFVRMSRIQLCTVFISESCRNTWLLWSHICITFVFDTHLLLKHLNSAPVMLCYSQVHAFERR